jgi:hypothetical protein
MLGEGVGESHRVLETGEPVAICDRFILFMSLKLEDEVLWESFCVTFDLLVQSLRRHAVQLC